MNVFDLVARILLNTDDYDRNLDDAGDRARAFGEKFKSGLATAAKVGAAAITATSAAVGVLAKQSVDGYAEFEQLVGGVETLFKTSADVVMEYANNAYQTAGLSANQYMETVTSFSASLLQGLGGDTEEAARIADLAITDMADNANKMGTAMDSIQNAYQGFAKQNYTMLDNLKLGYGGTQAEMARLINDSGVLGGTMEVTAETVNQVSFDKMIEAIHVVQTEMGITGTTAAEAASTIQGSVSAAKSAWANLVAGIGNENADLDQLISNLVTSAETAAGNILPRLTQILSGMGTAIEQLAPLIVTEIPPLITSVLPSLVSGGAQLLTGLITGIISALPDLVSAVPEIVSSIVSTLSDNFPAILQAGSKLLNILKSGISMAIPSISAVLPDLMQTGLSLLSGFTASLRENAGLLVDAALELAKNIAVGLANSIPTIIEQVPIIVSNIAGVINDNGPKILAAGVQIIGTLIRGIISAIPTLVKNIPSIIAAIVDVITAFNWINLGGTIIHGFLNGITGMIGNVRVTAQTIVQNFRTVISDLPGYMKSIGIDMINGLINGIKSMASAAVDAAKSLAGSVVDGVSEFLGIHSPSRVFAGIGGNMALGLAEGWEDELSGVRSRITRGMDFGTASVDFSESGLTQSSRAVSRGVVSAVSNAGAEQDIIINLTATLDGAVLAQKMYRYNNSEASRRGPSLVGA